DIKKAYFFVFFFQAEDGIRDGHVTGVQTCALPISNCATGRDICGSFITALIVDSPCGELGSQQRGLLRKRRSMAATARLEPRETQRTQQRAGSELMSAV